MARIPTLSTVCTCALICRAKFAGKIHLAMLKSMCKDLCAAIAGASW